MDDDRTPPEEPQSPPPPPPPPAPERRLQRSRTDRVLFGVCGGIAKHFGVDATLVRIVAVALVLFGGAGALLYLAAALLMPEEPVTATGPEAPTTVQQPQQRNRALVIVGAVLLVLVAGPLLLPPAFLIATIAVPLGILALLGVLVWWLASGRRPEGGAGDVARAALLGTGILLLCSVLFVASAWVAALGGDLVIAWLVIGAGVALVAGAFVRPVRWLIVPALAVAIPAGFVGAAGIDIDGGVGELSYRPSALAEVAPRYEIGMGQVVVDLRNVELPRNEDTEMKMQVGLGEAVVIVPEDVCVATRAQIGMGDVEVLGRDSGGVDVEWIDTPEPEGDNPRLLVDADIGLGVLRVVHGREALRDWDRDWDDHDWREWRDGVDEANTGCVGEGRAS